MRKIKNRITSVVQAERRRAIDGTVITMHMPKERSYRRQFILGNSIEWYVCKSTTIAKHCCQEGKPLSTMCFRFYFFSFVLLLNVSVYFAFIQNENGIDNDTSSNLLPALSEKSISMTQVLAQVILNQYKNDIQFGDTILAKRTDVKR